MLTEYQLQEFIKCKDDPVYFINNYVKFVTIDKGLIDFKLYPYQENLINKYHNNCFNICKSPRQMGKTSIGLFYILHHIIFNDNVTDGIFSPNTLNTLQRLQTAYENLPEWMKHKVIPNDNSTLELENGSRVIVGNATCSSFKYRTFNITFLDEFAFVPDKDAQDIVDIMLPIPMFTATKSCKIIIASSIKSQDDCFNKIWKDSEEGKNDFVRTTIKWYQVPGRDEKWKEQIIANIGIDAWESAYECHHPMNQLLKEPINYFDEIIKEYNRLKEIEHKYNELIYQVVNVFPLETRHETALRYIKNAETLSLEPPKQN